MNNIEKYRFDDFTFKNYEKLIRIAKDNGFQFIFHSDEYIDDRKDVIWRHDVEFEPNYALRMAQIENKLGVKSTYFFQLHCPLYNILDGIYTKIFYQIRDLGHKVGLHFDSAYWGINSEEQLDKYILIDKVYMEDNLGVEIDTFSFHNTTPFTMSCLEYKYGGLINVYSNFYKSRYNYCSDSLGYWRFDRLEDVLNDKNVMHLQVLTHDANWSDDVKSPRQRFTDAIYMHADRLVKNHIEFLHSRGLLCPADDED